MLDDGPQRVRADVARGPLDHSIAVVAHVGHVSSLFGVRAPPRLNARSSAAGRFSAKARAPSWASSEWKTASTSSRCIGHSSSSVRPGARRTMRLTACDAERCVAGDGGRELNAALERLPRFAQAHDEPVRRSAGLRARGSPVRAISVTTRLGQVAGQAQERPPPGKSPKRDLGRPEPWRRSTPRGGRR